MKKGVLFLFLGILWLCATSALRAESWTNQAGRVIEGRLDEFDGAFVTLIRTNGSRFQLPLNALCAADQRRVRASTGQPVTPEFVQAAYRDALTVIERFQRLPEHQRTEETLSKARRMACAAFDARIKNRQGELKGTEVAEEIADLRASLAGQ